MNADIGGCTMNNPNRNNGYNESTKDNFVLLYSNNLSKEKKVKARLVGHTSDRIKSREIIEYTDDVAEQVRILYEKITVNLEDYYKGKIKIEDVNNKMKQFYKCIKNYCMTTDLINENNEAYKSKILKDIYRNYRYNAVIAAVNVNDFEGRKVALEVSDLAFHSYEIYYNSTYYYKCEELRESLTQMAYALADEENIRFFDTESIDRRKRYVYDFGFNYAWAWNNKFSNENGVCINKNLVPPNNISIFYKEYVDSHKDGKLIITYNNNLTEVELQTKYSLQKEKYSVYNILQDKNIQMRSKDDMKEFLDSLCISIVS
jgi:hypothetical protein